MLGSRTALHAIRALLGSDSVAAGAALVNFKRTEAGALARTVRDIVNGWVRVLDFIPANLHAGIKARTNVTDLTAYLASALAAVPASGGALVFEDGEYLGTLSVRRDNVAIIGPGSASCKLKHPPIALTNVLELGDTASGNGAAVYSGVTVHGITLDGNRANTAAPASDLVGHGLPMTKVSNFKLSDVRAVNCHNAGVGIFINSNYGDFDVFVENCGNAIHTAPGFDINSSKYLTGRVVSKDCYNGARVLDNCYAVTLSAAIHNATTNGFVANNQVVNASHSCVFNVAVFDGCSDNGASVGANFRNSIFNLTINDVTGNGFQAADQGANNPDGNIFNIATANSGQTGVLFNADNCTLNLQSYLDGRVGAQGSSFAIDIGGNNNKIMATVVDSAVWQVRGLAVRAGATDNEIVSYDFLNTADPFSDAGTRTRFNHGEGQGEDIASAGIINIPLKGSLFTVTGNTNIGTITAGAHHKGRRITLVFAGVLTLSDGGSQKLSAPFITSADDTITLVCDGASWIECARSAN